jgi:hypothetical protein
LLAETFENAGKLFDVEALLVVDAFVVGVY